jgi:sarcosine oxidase subunit gamma
MLEAASIIFPAHPLIQPVKHRSIVSIAALGGQPLPLPATARRITDGGTQYVWSGPNAWLAISENTVLFQELSERFGAVAALTDQSDGLTSFRVIGPQARAALAKLVPIDLHDSAFPPDAAAITLAGHIGVRIWQEDDGAFCLTCFRSFAQALHHALVQAVQEFRA